MSRCSSYSWAAFIGNGGLEKKNFAVDLSKRRLLASFTSIDPIQVQDALAEVVNNHGTVGLTIIETEVEFNRIEKMLKKNVSILRSVFHCYCVREGEVLRMSHAGFTSFLQDIEVLEKNKIDGDDVFRVLHAQQF